MGLAYVATVFGEHMGWLCTAALQLPVFPPDMFKELFDVCWRYYLVFLLYVALDSLVVLVLNGVLSEAVASTAYFEMDAVRSQDPVSSSFRPSFSISPGLTSS